MTIAQVRTLTSDHYQYDRALLIADGIATDFALPNPPVKAGSEKVYVGGVLKADPADYTLDDAIGLVSFVAAPGAQVNVVVTYQWSLLSDDDITTFLALQSDVRLAAADALDTIASSEALVLKVITIMDLTTNGASVAQALRAHAKSLRDEVAAALDAADPGFDVAEQVLTDFNARERILTQALRLLP